MKILFSLLITFFINASFAQNKMSEINHMNFISSFQGQMKYNLSYFEKYSEIVFSEKKVIEGGMVRQSRKLEIKQSEITYTASLYYRKSDSLIFSFSQIMNGDTIGVQMKNGNIINYNPLKLEVFVFYNNCSMNINWSEKYPFLMFFNESED